MPYVRAKDTVEYASHLNVFYCVEEVWWLESGEFSQFYNHNTGRVFFFFFQAEDGIRDYKVTGVQTCALPIYLARVGSARHLRVHDHAAGQRCVERDLADDDRDHRALARLRLGLAGGDHVQACVEQGRVRAVSVAGGLLGQLDLADRLELAAPCAPQPAERRPVLEAAPPEAFVDPLGRDLLPAARAHGLDVG